MDPAEARAYDEAVRNPATAMALDWLVEQRLLTDILGSWAGPECRAADFACGTGRVLQFLESICQDPVGIDISPSMLALARRRCPDATLICGDVTVQPDLVPDTFDIVTAFRFFLNADSSLRADALNWMRSAVRVGGLVVANFHLTPRSARGAYLRLHAAEQLPMCSTAQAEELFTKHGFTVRQFLGYNFLPYRRDGRKLLATAARRAVELTLAGHKRLLPVAGSFLVVAEARPRESI